MKIYVFAGPTISRTEVLEILPGAACLGPAAQGDIYRVAQQRPVVIALIDGYFEMVPAVWHKEILWAMANAVHVFGSSSMGALRAAELTGFGMEGVGKVFEQFHSGELEDDDEVAVVHGPADSGYRPMSEAMVNIRATLRSAKAQDVISAGSYDKLKAIAKGLHYPDRSYRELLNAAEACLTPDEAGALSEWLPSGRIDVKHDDARQVLHTISARLDEGLEPKVVDYELAYTEAWHRSVQNRSIAYDVDTSDSGAVFGDALLDELRLNAAGYAGAERAAFVRLLAVFFARQRGVDAGADMLGVTAERFRRERGLMDESELEHWLVRNHLARADFLRLMRDEALLRWAEKAAAPALTGYLVDQLRVAGDYEALVERAQDKGRLLAGIGLDHPALNDIGLDERDLMRWYLHEQLGWQIEVSLDEYATLVGYEQRGAFLNALVREYCYLKTRGHDSLR